MSKRTLVCLPSLALALLWSRQGEAQLAPTGTHYAGRPTDTGHTGPNDQGGYSTSIPLDLPPSRGGLPVPVQIVSGGRGFGAAGVGWDLPLSFVHDDRSYNRRRPANHPGEHIRPRERIYVSLPGREAEMIPKGDGWIGRNAPDLLMYFDFNSWSFAVYDGNGSTYTFTYDPDLLGTDLWLLDSIVGPGGAKVKLDYAVAPVTLPGATSPAVSIDLVSVRYNPHPSVADCFKHEIALQYQIPLNEYPQSLSVLGDRVLVRDHRLAAVDVTSRAGCDTPPQRLRRYSLSYQIDRDAQRERLRSVSVSGRQGTPEETVALPVAEYAYGHMVIAAANPMYISYEDYPPQSIRLPDRADVIADTDKVADSVFQSPISGSTSSYVSRSHFIDMTGDGRPDLVYQDYQDGKLWIARNVPGPNGTTQFAAPALLNDSTFTRPFLDARSATSDRFGAPSNSEYVWVQAIDVNGDGRVDVVDAAEQPNFWTVYVNTPDSGPSGIKWVKRAYRISTLYNKLSDYDLPVASGYLPLSRRFTARDYNDWMCWKWDEDIDDWVRYPDGIDEEPGCFTAGKTLPSVVVDVEKTYVEWEVKDINGDGYPDVVLNSSPVGFALEGSVPISSPPGPVDSHYRLGVANYVVRPLRLPNRVEVAMNVRGVFFGAPPASYDPFSVATVLIDSSTCGVGKWSGDIESQLEKQILNCGLMDVNGDGLTDRIEASRDVLLGTGLGFETVNVKLPMPLGQESGHPVDCPNNPPYPERWPWSYARQTTALRDFTGDGIPDFIELGELDGDPTRLYIGTGAGFAGAQLSETTFFPGTSINVYGMGPISYVDETCYGSESRTVAGLYDVDADGKPEAVFLDGIGGAWHLVTYRLAGGSAPGIPEAGRLVQIDNGYGARTAITYRSAKKDGTTLHQVPFPEIVVSKIHTTGEQNFGGTLAATEYAYGGIELFYDSTQDSFRSTGYQRRVERTTTSGPTYPELQATAKIVDRHRLEPFSLLLDRNERFARYQRVGQVSDVTLLAGPSIDSDPWSLLSVDIGADSRRISQVHYEQDARLFAEPPLEDDFCLDVMWPYDFEQSFVDNFGPNGLYICSAHGFAYTKSTNSWRGSEAPPSTANVQDRSSVLSIDDYGRVTSVLHENDSSRSDDDVCVDTTFATPTDSIVRLLSAVSSRSVWGCNEAGTPVYAEESFEYDKLFYGVVSQGLVTAHTVYRHKTGTGEYSSTVREYDADYNVTGNPFRFTQVRAEDGATRTTTIEYDEFGLVPGNVSVAGTNVPTLSVSRWIDPVSLEVVGVQDANGTISGTTFDGFGRPIRETLDAQGIGTGVVVARSYHGFDGNDPLGLGRHIVVKEFSDPVNDVINEEGRTRTTYLDELGRLIYSEVELGDDYANQKLVVGARTYDGLGRVAFEADPYVASGGSSIEPVYGTTQYFNKDGSLWLSIRGRGPQPFTSTPDASVERFPTLFEHTYANHQESMSGQGPDALTPGSPQFGIRREAIFTATGHILSRSTWQNWWYRLEHAQLAYDRLGQQTKLIRFQDPLGGSQPVEWSWQLDSAGQILALTEPASAPQERTYSSFGELNQVTWRPSSQPVRNIMKMYDAFGRLTSSVEQNGGVYDPDTAKFYAYDVPAPSPLVDPRNVLGRLSVASGSTGDISFSYDGLGRVNARTFVDQNGVYAERHGFHADGSQAWIELNLPDNSYASERVDYAYDSAGRMRWMWFSDGLNTVPLYDASSVDAWGRVLAARFGFNGQYSAGYAVSGRRLPTNVSVVEDTWDPNQQSARVFSLGHYDPVGREMSRNELFFDNNTLVRDDLFTAAYDSLGRLQTSQRSRYGATLALSSFQYDALGNILFHQDHVGTTDAFMSYLTTDRDQICRIGYGDAGLGGTACNVVYDSFGNIIREPTRSGYNEFTYFNSGDVRGIWNQSGAVATFRYDPFGEVKELDIVRGSTTLRSDRRYGAFITKRSQSGQGGTVAFTARQFPGPGLVVSRRGASGPFIYEFGELRGTRLATNPEGEPVQDLSYAPFGETTSTGAQPGSAAFSTDQWNGGDALDGFGLVHLGARIYDPVIGRFLSRDPLLIPRTAATSNPYAFAFNDPLNISDPTGLDACAKNPKCAAALGGLAASVWNAIGLEMPIHFSTPEEMNAYSSGFREHNVWLQANSSREDPWDTSDCNGRCRAIRRMDKNSPDDLLHRAPILDGSSFTEGRVRANGVAATMGLAIVSPPVAKGLALLAISQAKTDGEALFAAIGGFFAGVIGPSRGVPTRLALAPTMSGDGDTLAAYGAMVPSQSDGYYNVVIHGTKAGFWVYENGTPVQIGVKEFANFVKATVPEGQPIRLISCQTGACANGPAQQLANELGVQVVAPTGKSWIDFLGAFGLVNPRARWKEFNPIP